MHRIVRELPPQRNKWVREKKREREEDENENKSERALRVLGVKWGLMGLA